MQLRSINVLAHCVIICFLYRHATSVCLYKFTNCIHKAENQRKLILFNIFVMYFRKWYTLCRIGVFCYLAVYKFLCYEIILFSELCLLSSGCAIFIPTFCMYPAYLSFWQLRIFVYNLFYRPQILFAYITSMIYLSSTTYTITNHNLLYDY